MFRPATLIVVFAAAGGAAWIFLSSKDVTEQSPELSAVRAAAQPTTDDSDERTNLQTGQERLVFKEEAGEKAGKRDSGQRLIPESNPLIGNSHAVRAPDFNELLAEYDSASASTLQQFNERYSGAIGFRTHGEFEWLSDHGFPLPEEILRAEQMPISDLRSLAETGYQKAQFLYLDRTLRRVRELRESYMRSGISPDGLSEIPEYADALGAAAYAKGFVTRSDSPFAGYLMAEFSLAAFGNPYGYMAGMLYASDRGDARAHFTLKQFMRDRGICEDALTAMGMYATLLEVPRVPPRNSPGAAGQIAQ